jgi:hypothetical protein
MLLLLQLSVLTFQPLRSSRGMGCVALSPDTLSLPHAYSCGPVATQKVLVPPAPHCTAFSVTQADTGQTTSTRERRKPVLQRAACTTEPLPAVRLKAATQDAAPTGVQPLLTTPSGSASMRSHIGSHKQTRCEQHNQGQTQLLADGSMPNQTTASCLSRCANSRLQHKTQQGTLASSLHSPRHQAGPACAP